MAIRSIAARSTRRSGQARTKNHQEVDPPRRHENIQRRNTQSTQTRTLCGFCEFCVQRSSRRCVCTGCARD
jgi:hypothetical protein